MSSSFRIALPLCPGGKSSLEGHPPDVQAEMKGAPPEGLALLAAVLLSASISPLELIGTRSTAPTAAAGNGQFPHPNAGAELTGFVSPHLSFVI